MSQLTGYNLLNKVVSGGTRPHRRRYFILLLVLGLMFIVICAKIQRQIREDSLDYAERQQGDFDFLRNINFLHRFMEPVADSAIIVPRNLSEVKERHYVACFVMSAPENSFARNAIRKTWGRLIRPIFLIGLGNDDLMNSVTREAQMYDDILVENFVDSYANLTLKTAYAMKNFIAHFAASKYFLKIDDDIFLNVNSLYGLLESVPRDSMVGKLNINAKVIRDKNNRWYVPNFLYDGDVFPPYFNGAAYSIPGHLVRSIYETSMDVPFLNMEDVFFIGVIAGKMLNIHLYHDSRFRISSISYVYPCIYEQFITVHGISPEDLMSLWKRFEIKKGCSVVERQIAKLYALSNNEKTEKNYEKALRQRMV